MFVDRKDAGIQLGEVVSRKFKDQKCLVLGIPRGGAETAYYVAKALGCEMDLIVSRKLGYPFNPEAAFGAMAEDGSLYLSKYARRELTESQIQDVINSQRQEIKSRIARLRDGRPLPELKGRTIILVDDGIATGATVFASIEMCRKKGALTIVVAAPVSGPDTVEALQKQADEVYVLEQPQDYHAVSQAYEEFHNLTDEKAKEFLVLHQRERLNAI